MNDCCSKLPNDSIFIYRCFMKSERRIRLRNYCKHLMRSSQQHHCKTETSSMQICRQYVDTYSSKHRRLTTLQRECVELQKTQTNKDSDKQRLTAQRQTLGVCFCLFTVFALIIPCFMPR